MTIQYLDLHQQYLSMKDEIDAALAGVIRDSAFIRGPYVQEFEESFAQYCEVEHGVGVGNGTDALEIAIEALELPKGSEVLLPAYTFIACAEAVTRNGLVPVFVDCDPKTYCLSVSDLESKLSKQSSAIMPVHLYGHPCEMDKIQNLALENGLKVIEDCSQAHGALFRGKRVGSFGDVATFSFYPGKNLGAYGDAGMITTSSKSLADRCRQLADHGRSQKYKHEFVGRNSRMDGLQGAVLNVKLKYLDRWIERRRQVASLYHEGLNQVSGLQLPQSLEHVDPVYHLYVIQSDCRDFLKEHLLKNGVPTGVHYPCSLPQQPAYAHSQPCQKMLADTLGSKVLSLPMGEHLSDHDVETILGFIQNL